MSVTGQRSFHELGTALADVPFCVLDLETTGVAPDTCEITEIGAVRYEGGVEVGRFQTLVNPRAPIPPTVVVMTGITQSMVIDAPLIEEALPSFLEFLSDAVIVGHNVRFDISFLNAAAIRLGYGRLPNRSTDTLRLARRLVGTEVRSFGLGRLARHFSSPVTPNHRALDDALATAHVFWALLERAGSIGVTHLDDLLALPTIKGSRAIGKLSLTERLPRRPGVYVFRDRSERVIYVGKATNLRSRVRSYFAGDHRRQVDAMLRDLERIDHITTSSETEAAVLELRLIWSERPTYNKRSKPPKSMHWVRVTSERFPRLSLVRSTSNGLAHIGPFRTRRAAEQVMLSLWDASPIRRCSTRGRGCEYSQLGVAVCPCDGDVSESSYRTIVHQLVDGIERDPRALLDGVDRRLRSLVVHERFEEAARCRDGWSSLAAALRRRRHWDALQRAGTIVARDDTAYIRIVSGRMDAVWGPGTPEPLPNAGPMPASRVPASMLEADEAELLWRWLNRPGTRLVGVSGSLALPTTRIPDLEPNRQATSEPGATGSSGAISTTPSAANAPKTRTSERKPPMRIGSNPFTTTT
jgi:DNA polymerase-3 subunit epsilon